MYRQSFFVVVLSLVLMGILFNGGKMIAAIPGLTGLPSSYDPNLSVEKAAETSDKPLLIEFYTDACGTCQHITPWMHKLSRKYKDEVTFVMVDVNDAANAQVAAIFGITFVPAIFVFDFKHMAKSQVSVSAYGSPKALDQGIRKAIDDAAKEAVAKGRKAA